MLRSYNRPSRSLSIPMTLHGGSAMGMTLSLVDGLLTQARTLERVGRDHDARQLLNRLAGLRELPANAAFETQTRLAEIHLRDHTYSRARRHLTAALAHQPENAHLHYLMAQALARDEKTGSYDRAVIFYRKSLEIDPNRPGCLAELGILLIQLGRSEEGLDSLRKAVGLAPSDPGVLAKLVEGLCLEGRFEEAHREIRAARFRNPRNDRIRRLSDEFDFQELHRQQAARRRSAFDEEDAEGPTILPFIRLLPDSRECGPGNKTVRYDGPSLPRPHGRRPNRQPGRRRAQ
jgi:Flp pilus assembly protein TadD